jgi:DNA-binding MarR family transcriptional regulator
MTSKRTKLERDLAIFASLDTLTSTHLPLHFVRLFLVVMRRKACTFEALQDELNITNSAVSRTVKALAFTHRKGHAGFDLLETYRDPAEGRRYLVRLSPKGEQIRRQLEL